MEQKHMAERETLRRKYANDQHFTDIETLNKKIATFITDGWVVCGKLVKNNTSIEYRVQKWFGNGNAELLPVHKYTGPYSSKVSEKDEKEIKTITTPAELLTRGYCSGVCIDSQKILYNFLHPDGGEAYYVDSQGKRFYFKESLNGYEESSSTSVGSFERSSGVVLEITDNDRRYMQALESLHREQLQEMKSLSDKQSKSSK